MSLVVQFRTRRRIGHKIGMRNPFRRQPKVEAKSALSEPDEELLELLTGVSTGSVSVSATEALTVPAVAAAVRILAEAAATLEINVIRTDDKGVDTIDNAHPAARLVRIAANDWTSAFELKRDLVAEALIRNAGGLAWVNRVDGKPVEIIQYQPGKIGVEYAETGEPTYRLNGTVIASENIIHVRGAFSRSPVSLAGVAIGVARVMEKHAARLFTSGAKPSGVIETPKHVGDQGVKNMLSGWKRAHEGADNAGKTAILYDGATFRALTLNSTDAQFLELRQFQILEIARAFRVPPSMLYELDRATWSNSEQMGREFLTYSLEPWLHAVEGALARALLTEEERLSWRFEFVRDDLTRADLGARATAYSSLIASRVINPNKARAWEGLEPYEGGNEYANPNTGSNQPGAAAPQGDDDQ